MIHEVFNWPGPMTHRQFLTWVAFEREEWNRPTLAEHYQMQTACEVRRVLSKKPREVKIDHFRMTFKDAKRKKPVEVSEADKQRTALSKGRWLGFMTMPVIKREIPADDVEVDERFSHFSE